MASLLAYTYIHIHVYFSKHELTSLPSFFSSSSCTLTIRIHVHVHVGIPRGNFRAHADMLEGAGPRPHYHVPDQTAVQ